MFQFLLKNNLNCNDIYNRTELNSTHERINAEVEKGVFGGN